jgi:UDP-glucuronate 4-epimerase
MLPMQAGDVRITMADVTQARKKLGYKPKVEIDEGISLFVDWYKDYYLKKR